MLKSAFVALSLTIIPSTALAERIPNADPVFLQRIQSYLSNKSNEFSQNISDELKITTGLRLCLSKYQGATEDDVKDYWTEIIVHIPEPMRRDAVDFAAALNTAAVDTYCPKFQGRGGEIPTF